MRHLEDAIHQMNGRVQGNQGHNGNNVNNVNNEVGINELIRLHRSSSSNRNFSVKLARIFSHRMNLQIIEQELEVKDVLTEQLTAN